MDLQAIIADLRRGGLTQVQIGAATGLSQTMISQLSTGDRGSNPSARTVEALRALWERERQLRDTKQTT